MTEWNGIIGLVIHLDLGVDRALKDYARLHSNISKSRAASEIVEEFLKENGFLDPCSTAGYNI